MKSSASIIQGTFQDRKFVLGSNIRQIPVRLVLERLNHRTLLRVQVILLVRTENDRDLWIQIIQRGEENETRMMTSRKEIPKSSRRMNMGQRTEIHCLPALSGKRTQPSITSTIFRTQTLEWINTEGVKGLALQRCNDWSIQTLFLLREILY